METKQNIKLQIVINPNISINDVDANYDKPQEFGGIKREITVKRNKVKELIKAKGNTYKTVSKSLGVKPYELRRFIKKQTLKPKVAETLFNNLYSFNLDEAKETVETKRFSGLNKMNIRYLFFEYILKSKKLKGNFLTLPSETCAFENELNVQTLNKFHYIGAEHDKNVFMEALQTIAKFKLKLSLTLGKIKNIITNSKPDFFAHAFLDYCGTFTTYENEVRDLITNNLVRRGGLIGLTFTTREANTKKQTCIEYYKSVLDAVGSNDTPTTIGGIKLKLLSFIGNDYKIVEFLDYHDDSHMVFVLLKRVN